MAVGTPDLAECGEEHCVRCHHHMPATAEECLLQWRKKLLNKIYTTKCKGTVGASKYAHTCVHAHSHIYRYTHITTGSHARLAHLHSHTQPQEDIYTYSHTYITRYTQPHAHMYVLVIRTCMPTLSSISSHYFKQYTESIVIGVTKCPIDIVWHFNT